MNILITGITSFIGQALVRQLLSEDWEVYGVVRPDSGKMKYPEGNGHLHIISLDMNDIGSLENMKNELPSMYACVHLAWKGTGKADRMNGELQEENKKASLELVKSAAALGCQRFIFAGSQAEYGITRRKIFEGKAEDRKTDEKTVTEPVSEYGKAKLSMLTELSEACRKAGMTYIHLRIFSVYGKGDHNNTLVSSVARIIKRDEKVALSPCDQKWNFIHVKDCAKAIADLVSCVFTLPEGGDKKEHVVNIASEDTRTLRDFVQEMKNCSVRGRIRFKDEDEYEEPPEGTPWLDPDIGKLRSLTGFTPRISFEEGIKEIINE